MLASSSIKKFSPEYNQQRINGKHRPQRPEDFAAYTGLAPEKARQWHRDAQAYIHDQLNATLDQVAAIKAKPSPVSVSGTDTVKAVLKAGALGYSASFLPAKAWVNLCGWLSIFAKTDPNPFFVLGALGYTAFAASLHPTATKSLAGGLAAQYGGPQAVDKAAWDNYITLLGMWYVASAAGQDSEVAEIEQAIQALGDGVIARARTGQEKGQPLSFDFRQHPLAGAALRTLPWHLAFFSFSFAYLGAGGLTPVLRRLFMDLPGPVPLRAGLFNLADLAVWIACGEAAGISTLSMQMCSNHTVQRGPSKPGLHQTWHEELEASLDKLSLLVPAHAQLVAIRNSIRHNIRNGQVDEEEMQRRKALFKQQVLPLLNDAIKQLRRKQKKHQRRSDLLPTPEGRVELAQDLVAAITLKGAPKTPVPLLNRHPEALRMRTAAEALGNALALATFSYAIWHLYSLFATTMPFTDGTETLISVPWLNGTDPGGNASLPAFNGTQATAGIPAETQLFSTLLGFILIAAFDTRALFIPMVELLLNLVYAGCVWLSGPADPPKRGAPSVETDDDDASDDPAPPRYKPAAPQDPSDLVSVEIDADPEPTDVQAESESVHSSAPNKNSRYLPSSVTVIEGILQTPRGQTDSSSSSESDDSDAESDSNSGADRLLAIGGDQDPSAIPQTPRATTVLQGIIDELQPSSQ